MQAPHPANEPHPFPLTLSRSRAQRANESKGKRSAAHNPVVQCNSASGQVNLTSMNKRGRPPYPDVLTPREWEVLEFLRQGLSNEQIAERLGITLRTAKFHVSEILSKLAVDTREQAAAWQPEAPPAPARRWLAWPLIARIAGPLLVVGALAGLGVLAWGVLQTSSGSEETSPRSLIFPNRDHFAICVVSKVESDGSASQVAEEIRQALPQLENDPRWLGLYGHEAEGRCWL